MMQTRISYPELLLSQQCFILAHDGGPNNDVQSILVACTQYSPQGDWQTSLALCGEGASAAHWQAATFGSVYVHVCSEYIPNVGHEGETNRQMQGFQGEFLWQGTSDTTAWLAAPAALHVMRGMGVDRWQQHNHQLLQEAVAFLLRSFQTDLTVGEHTDLLSLAMCTLNLK